MSGCPFSGFHCDHLESEKGGKGETIKGLEHLKGLKDRCSFCKA